MSADLELLIQLRDQASAQLQQINSNLQANQQQWKDNYATISQVATKVGVEMAAMGAAIIGALALVFNASEDERVSMARLQNTIADAGGTYGDTTADINNMTQAIMEQTGISKTSQMDALNQLIITTGSYQTALNALPVALDLASAKGMDASQAALYLGKAMEGDTTSLKRFGIEIPAHSTSLQTLQIIMDKVGGSADAMASPIDILKNTFGELADSIGGLLLPVIQTFVAWIVPVIDYVKQWVEGHKTLATIIVVVTGVLGTLLLAMGTLLIITGQIFTANNLMVISFVAQKAAALASAAATDVMTAAQWALNIAMDANPIGIVILALGVLATAIYEIYANWEKVKDFFQSDWGMVIGAVGGLGATIIYIIANWDKLKLSALEAAKAIVDGVNWVNEVLGIQNDALKNSDATLGQMIEDTKTDISTNQQLTTSINDVSTAIDGVGSSVDATTQKLSTMQASAEAAMQALYGDNVITNDVTGHANSYLLSQGYVQDSSGSLVPAMASGGIVTSPTMAMIGESGPEAVIPLSNGGSFGGSTTVNNFTIQGSVMTENDMAGFIRRLTLKTKDRNVNAGLA